MILNLVCFNNLYLRSQKIFKIHRFKKFLGQIKLVNIVLMKNYIIIFYLLNLIKNIFSLQKLFNYVN